MGMAQELKTNQDRDDKKRIAGTALKLKPTFTVTIKNVSRGQRKN